LAASGRRHFHDVLVDRSGIIDEHLLETEDTAKAMNFALCRIDLRPLCAPALFAFAAIAPLGCVITDEPITTASTASAAKKPDGTSGPFTVSGHVRDMAGNPVPGIGIAMHGNAQADRTTDATGSYSFQVSAGTYTLHPSGPCNFDPQAVNLNKLADSRIVDFVAGAGCIDFQVLRRRFLCLGRQHLAVCILVRWCGDEKNVGDQQGENECATDPGA